MITLFIPLNTLLRLSGNIACPMNLKLRTGLRNNPNIDLLMYLRLNLSFLAILDAKSGLK